MIRLFELFYAQRAYYRSNGVFARTLSELDYRHSGIPVVTLHSDGERWLARMARQGDLPGHYLLSGEGQVHFSSEHLAATNDLLLRVLQ